MRELSKKDRLLDFTAFVLASYPSLPWKGNAFFSQGTYNRTFTEEKPLKSENYKTFIEEDLKDILSPNFWRTQRGMDKLSSFISAKEIERYLDKLKDKFSHLTNSKESRSQNGSIYFHLSKEDLELNFDSYRKLYWLNNNVFISYYLVQLKSLNIENRSELDDFRNEMESFCEMEKDLSSEDWNHLLKEKHDKINNELLKNLEILKFQFQGYLDSEGVFINIDETLKEYLLNLRVNNSPSYPMALPLREKSLTFLKLKIFENTFNYKPKKVELSQEEILVRNKFEDNQKISSQNNLSREAILDKLIGVNTDKYYVYEKYETKLINQNYLSESRTDWKGNAASFVRFYNYCERKKIIKDFYKNTSKGFLGFRDLYQFYKGENLNSPSKRKLQDTPTKKNEFNFLDII